MGYSVKDLLIFSGIVLFLVLILWDITMSLLRGASWVPGEALVLTGLTIQILGYIETQNINASAIQSLVESQLSIDCARVTMCVFVGFLLPRMAALSTGTKWSNILALLVSISTHISTEVYVIQNANDVGSLKRERVWWFVGSGGVLLLSIISLIVLLGYVVIAGKFISENLSRRIPKSLDRNKLENGDNAQEIFEYEMLKTWLVTRVCQPEYVIARSMFSAATGGIVTCCVALFGVKVILLRSLVNRVPLFCLQCVFILIGWTFIFYRWLMSVFYFRGVKESWYNSSHVFLSAVSRYFLLQKIIFGFTVYDLMGMKNSALCLRLRECNSYSKIKLYLKFIGITIKVLISPFIIVPWLAIYFTTATLTILLSMFFWGLLSFLCYNKYMRSLCKVWRKSCITAEPGDELKKYEKVLESVVIYGEDPARLWIQNRRSFKYIKSGMRRAFESGKGCEELIDLMRSSDTEISFVDRLKHFVDQLPQFQEMLEYFPVENKRTWRMTALSLVKMITEVGDSFSPDDVRSNSIVQDAVLAYKQARDLMDFADCPDNVHVNAESFSTTNMERFLLRYQAEKDFWALKTLYRHWKFGRRVKNDDDSVVEALDKCTPKIFERSARIRKLFTKSLYYRKLAENCKNPCESIHSATFKHFQRLEKKARLGCACWEDVAPTYSLLQVAEFIKEQEIGDPELLLDRLRSFLANVLSQSLSGLPEKVVESCYKWAANFEEEKISKAIDIAGKAFAVGEEAKKMK